MILVRPPAVAGTFYPSDRDELTRLVDELLDHAARHAAGNEAGAQAGMQADAQPGGPPIALIAPHAGYVYSGPVAASAYAHLRPWRREITRVVVVGPAHRVAVHGLALSSARAFDTPLGRIPTDWLATELLMRRGGAHVDDKAHQVEHSVEVQLPFLQRVLGTHWSLVPVVAGAASATEVADALETVWGADGTLVVISTDLSHYHDHRTARRLDAATAAAIVAEHWEVLDGEHACGAVPVRGALELARRHAETVELLDLRTSADTAGPAARVVGYGSFLVHA